MRKRLALSGRAFTARCPPKEIHGSRRWLLSPGGGAAAYSRRGSLECDRPIPKASRCVRVSTASSSLETLLPTRLLGLRSDNLTQFLSQGPQSLRPSLTFAQAATGLHASLDREAHRALRKARLHLCCLIPTVQTCFYPLSSKTVEQAPEVWQYSSMIVELTGNAQPKGVQTDASRINKTKNWRELP